MGELLSGEQRQRLQQDRQLDFSYELEGLGRFRGSAMLHNNGISGVFRIIPPQVPTLEQLGMPAVIQSILDNHQGILHNHIYRRL